MTDHRDVPLVPDVPLLTEVLDDLYDFFGTYVSFPSEQAHEAVCGWVVHTWCVEAFESTPRLMVTSPEKQSGKTRLFECVELVAYRPIRASSTTPAALFRSIGEGIRTFLMDEADTYLGWKTQDKHEDLRNLVNTGHRKGGVVLRTERVAKDHEVKEWPTFAPIALAGIGDLPDTIMDRSIVIAMKRQRSQERLQPFRQKQARCLSEPIVEKLEQLQDQLMEVLEDYEPEMPPGIVDRPADVWEPLIMIGDIAPHGWSEGLRDAAVVLTKARRDHEPTVNNQLLTDIRTIFCSDHDRLATDHLLSELNALVESPWGGFKPSGLDARGLARRLKPYEVKSTKIRISERTFRGYRREDFEEAWDRWCPPVVSPHVEHVEHVEHPEEDPTRPF